MQAAIVVIIILQIIADVIVVLSLLGQNFLLALLSLALAVLSLVPLFALLRCLGDISDLHAEIYSLKNQLHRLEKEWNAPLSDTEQFQPSPEPQQKMTANQRWSCVKCGTVNRAGTEVCENCGSGYSFAQQGVSDAPLTKWRLKGKKKK